MKYGAIALVGKPNVGKSTIINNIFHEPISIVNQKPQTTRDEIAKIYQDENYKVLFVDTPGFHDPQTELDKFLNGEIYRAWKLCPVIFVIADITRPFDEEDDKIGTKLSQLTDHKYVLIVNKTDIKIKEDEVNDVINKWKAKLNFAHIINTNQNTFNIHDILNQVSDLLETNENLINFIEHNLDDKFIIKESIRNVILHLVREEVPYQCAVVVTSDHYNKEKNTYTIHADIIVGKESHKPIVIGKGGQMIKQIGIQSRIELAQIYDCNINLFLEVKVKPNWQNNNESVKAVGYVINK